MITSRHIRIDEYDYPLPEERIAKFPLSQRDQSKLLVRRNNTISEDKFEQLSQYLPENALLVFNNTKVIQARMIFHKETGAQVEVFCLEPKIPGDYVQVFSQNKECAWLCMIGNLKRWKSGVLTKEVPGMRCTVQGERIESYGETHLVRFSWDNPELTFAEILDRCGELPIPPYLNRKTEDCDKDTYQTVYSKIKGSVAAPTAGLHFTGAVFDSLKMKNISCEELTLHVGAGTFKPVKTETIADHLMHTECFSVNKSVIEKLIAHEGRVFAVGTTSVRTLESLYYMGVKLAKYPQLTPDALAISQWYPYEEDHSPCSVAESMHNLLQYMDSNGLDRLTSQTQIMIVPGYSFKVVKGIITNFHQPKSTLLLLVSAFLSGDWKSVYNYALNNDFRFLSYGDSSLLISETLSL